MSKCPNCGSKDVGKFCKNCGTEIPEILPETTEQSNLSEVQDFLDTWLETCPVCKDGRVLNQSKEKLSGLIKKEQFQCEKCFCSF